MIFYNKAGKALRFNNFAIIKTIAKGGFGTLFLLQDKEKNFSVLKQLHQTSNVKRIQTYLSILQKLNAFTCFLPFYEFKKTKASFFLRSAYATGGDLSFKIKKEGVLSESESKAFLYDMLKSLETLDKLGVIHHNIKPENIVFDQGRYFLIDWDIAQTTHTIQTVHMLSDTGYVAPEVYKKEVTCRGDIYSLGCSLYYLLTGESIYGFTKEMSFVQKMYAHLYEQPKQHPNLSDAMYNLIMNMVQKEPSKRLSLNELDTFLEIEHCKTHEPFHVYPAYLDDESALEFLANDGVSYATNMLALQYEMGNEGVKDLKKAFSLYQKAVEEGSIKAMFNLGLCYLYGKATQIDLTKANACFKKASSLNHEKSFYYLGLMVEKNDATKAKEYFMQAAFRGYTPVHEKLLSDVTK